MTCMHRVGTVNGCSQQKGTICDACGPSPSILSILKPNSIDSLGLRVPRSQEMTILGITTTTTTTTTTIQPIT